MTPLTTIRYGDLIGVPFVHRGRDHQSGLDCIGVLLELYRRAGVELGRFDVEYDSGDEIRAIAESWPDIWEEIDRATEILDVVQVGKSLDELEHVMVDVGDGKLLHTSSRNALGVHVVRRAQIDWKRTRSFRLCLPQP